MDSRDNAPVQFIDAHGNFLETLSDKIKSWGLFEKGSAYHIIAILGAQGSGKSTLLNMLFGTDFNVMDARNGRYQTTLGVWLGYYNSPEAPILIADVEGTDSRERGEDHGLFERRTSLLSLALAEVLIVNMWMTDIGRHDGANYTLLRVVFEMNLQLFQVSPKRKSKLLFIFRDHSQNERCTPLDLLINMVKVDLENIWQEITKTDASRDWTITDVFEVNFVSLASLLYQKEEFEKQVSELRARFTDPTRNDSLISKDYRNNVPADGLAHYIQEVWKIILLNQDLNLPSQRQMLATVRCGQISQQTFEELERELHNWSLTLQQGTQQECGQKLRVLVKNALETYDKDAQRYDEKVNQIQRLNMLKQMQLEVVEKWNQHINWVINTHTNQMNIELSALVTDPDNSDSFYQKVMDCHVRHVQEVIGWIDQGRVPEFEFICEWQKEPLKAEISQKFHALSVQRCVQVFDSCVRRAHASFSAAFIHWIDANLSSSEYDHVMEGCADTQRAVAQCWDNIRNFESNWVQKCDTELDRQSSQLKRLSDRLLAEFEGVTSPEIFIPGEKTYTNVEEMLRQKFERFKKDLLKTLQKCVESEVEKIGWLMEKQFFRCFALDQQGVPHRSYGHSLKQYYLLGCQHGQFILDAMSVFRFDPSSVEYSYFVPGQSSLRIKEEAVPEALAVISREKVVQFSDHFLNYARNTYTQASIEQERAQRKSYTWLVAVVMFLVFGWNETSYILARPWLLVLLLLGSSFGLFAYYSHLVRIVLPAFTYMLRSALGVNEVQQAGVDKPSMVPEQPVRQTSNSREKLD